MDEKFLNELKKDEDKIRELIVKQVSKKSILLDLVFQQTNKVIVELEKDNQEFIDLYNQNFDLLTCSGFQLVVTQEEGNPFSSYSKELMGDIYPNGYLYLSTKKTNFLFSSLQSGLYPKQYAGIINGLGKMQARATKLGFIILGGRLPQKYEGNIDSDGNIHIKTTKTLWESGGNYFVSKIVGDPFNKNEISRKRFLENRQRLNQIILDFRNNL